MPNESARELYLSRLRINNFRSIAELDVPIGPLTVLVGPNGSGKSNIVDALRFVRDCLTRGLDQALLDRGGLDAVRRWVGNGSKPDLHLGVSYASHGGQNEVSFDFTLGVVNKKVRVRHEAVATKGFGMPSLLLTRDGENYSLYQDGKAVAPNNAHGRLDPLANDGLAGPGGMALVVFLRYDNGVAEPALKSALRRFRIVVSALGDSLAKPLFYTLNPMQLRLPQQLVRAAPLDEAGQNLAAVLRQLRRHKDIAAELRLILSRVANGLDDFAIETAGSFLVGYLYYNDGKDKARRSDLGQESDGTLRALGILAALYQLIPPTGLPIPDGTESLPFLAIEEPEVHIHPGVLAVLAELFVEASRRKQILLTTHSPDLLDYLPPDSFLVVEKSNGLTQAGPLDPVQVEVARQQLFSPGELLRNQGLHRAPDAPAAQ